MKKLLPALLIFTLLGCGKKTQETQSQTSTLAYALQDYQAHGDTISTLENKEIFELLVAGNRNAQYTPYERSKEMKMILDPWGRPLKFFRNEDNQIIPWSAGTDGVFDDDKASDDIIGIAPPTPKESIQSR